MNPKAKGALATLASAFLFGATPVLARLSYNGGSNGVMLSFLRSFLALPVLFAALKLKKIPIGIPRRTLLDVAVMGTFGTAATAVLFNSSYHYIHVGLTTVLNCTYPFFVVVISMVIFREKATRVTVLSLLMAMAGVVMFTDFQGGGQMRGVVMAALSAVTFAFVMIYQYHSALIHLHPLKLSFWTCVVVSVDLLVFSLLTGYFTLSLTTLAWLYTFVVSICVSVLGLSLLQYGLGLVGASAASILSMLEPITSVAMGVLVLGEPMTLLKAAGCLLVLAAVTVLTLASGKPVPAQEDVEKAEEPTQIS